MRSCNGALAHPPGVALSERPLQPDATVCAACEARPFSNRAASWKRTHAGDYRDNGGLFQPSISTAPRCEAIPSRTDEVGCIVRPMFKLSVGCLLGSLISIYGLLLVANLGA